MSDADVSRGHRSEARRYEIRLKGRLDARWSDWFEGLTMTALGNGETLLTGLVADQAALHGLLKKVRDLGMPLLSVMQVDSKQVYEPADNEDTDHHRSDEEINT